jgi:hypothetical protein
MAAIGARMLAPEKNGVEAAETLFMRHSGENSILSAIAIAVGNGLTEALNMFAAWAEEAGEVSFAINRDFMPIALMVARWLLTWALFKTTCSVIKACSISCNAQT